MQGNVLQKSVSHNFIHWKGGENAIFLQYQ